MADVPVILGLGSNRSFHGAEPVELLEKACCSLSGRLSCMRCSSVYATQAMYYADQSDFFNMAVAGLFAGTPQELLGFIHEIESSLGRDRSTEFRNGPRSMDIDIEIFGSVRLDTPLLQLPHPRLAERAFVLIPMLEILRLNAEAININVDFYEECLRKLPEQGVRRLEIPRFRLPGQ